MRYTLIVAALAALAVAGCATPYRTPQFQARDGGPTDFEGIAAMLRPDRPLDVVFVHGMCTHGAPWAQGAVRSVVEALGESGSKVELTATNVDGTGIVLHQQTLTTRRGKLRANAIVWSPLTTPLKGQLCYDQTNKSPTCPPAEAAKTYPYERASLNRLLKDTILDDCLADAMIYQGKSRDDINQQMQQALLQAVATSGRAAAIVGDIAVAAAAVPEDLPLIVVTESLGSKVAFDALYKLSQGPAAAAGDRTWSRITQIFMSANQLPILALADRKLDGSVASLLGDATGYPEDPIAALLARRSGLLGFGRSLPAPRVVAFTDPNDLLSFLLSPSPHAAEAKYPVVDVVVSNKPSYFGQLARPDSVHTGYRGNPAVGRLMTCGYPESKDCRK